MGFFIRYSILIFLQNQFLGQEWTCMCLKRRQMRNLQKKVVHTSIIVARVNYGRVRMILLITDLVVPHLSSTGQKRLPQRCKPLPPSDDSTALIV